MTPIAEVVPAGGILAQVIKGDQPRPLVELWDSGLV